MAKTATNKATATKRAALQVNKATASLRDIDRNINQIKTLSRRLDPLIHETAMAIMAHAEAHNDCSRAALLVDAMPKSSRRNALMQWFLDFSPIIVQSVRDKKTGESVVKAKLAKEGESKHFKAFDIEGARAMPFYDYKREADFVVLDGEALDKQVVSLIKRLREGVTKGKVADGAKPKALALADAIEAAVANL